VFGGEEEVGARGFLRMVRRACWSLNKERKNIDDSFVRTNRFVGHKDAKTIFLTSSIGKATTLRKDLIYRRTIILVL
jgi:hypothetical protein